jgi:broad specificity phosphatase PhoE
MQTVFLIRHGYPLSWDQKLKVRGTAPHLRLDPTLADIGRAQAHATAVALQAIGGITTVLSSPFRACLETADVLATATSVAVNADWKLGNVLLSTVLGSPFSPGSSMDPDWLERRKSAGKPAHPESDQTIHERLTVAVRELKARKPLVQKIVIVSHEIILKELLKHMTGRTLAIDWHPCAMTTVTRATLIDRHWKLVGLPASHQHLGSTDRTEPVEHIEHRYHPLDSQS